LSGGIDRQANWLRRRASGFADHADTDARKEKHAKADANAAVLLATTKQE